MTFKVYAVTEGPLPFRDDYGRETVDPRHSLVVTTNEGVKELFFPTFKDAYNFKKQVDYAFEEHIEVKTNGD